MTEDVNEGMVGAVCGLGSARDVERPAPGLAGGGNGEQFPILRPEGQGKSEVSQTCCELELGGEGWPARMHI